MKLISGLIVYPEVSLLFHYFECLLQKFFFFKVLEKPNQVKYHVYYNSLSEGVNFATFCTF